MTRSQIEASLIRSGKTRAQARHEGGRYDPENDPADNGHDDELPPELSPVDDGPYPPEWADFDEDLAADDGRWDNDPNVYEGNYSEE